LSFRAVLLTENTFHACYLVTRWSLSFGDSAPVVLRADQPPRSVREARDDFHRRHEGVRELGDADWATFEALYSGAGQADRAMIELYGVPSLSVTSGTRTYLGNRLNTEDARFWLNNLVADTPKPFLMVFLDRILASWWITGFDGRIINAHSAVLPVARGSFAVEQVAASEDRERFLDAVGATTHYVDAGIDTGPIIEARSLGSPWQFQSIWQVKAACFNMAFDLLMKTAAGVVHQGRPPHRGEPQGATPGHSDFKRADFGADRQRRAELGFQRMRLSG
jgi:phosphoribosylglycinamide formyltransferase-1